MAKVLSATPWGIEARPVEVEVDVQNGIPKTSIVGLPDVAIKESRERVRSAIRNSGFRLEPVVTVINLAPADLPKEGNHLDLAIALALLAAHKKVDRRRLRGRLVCGELGLEGDVRPVRAALAIAALARDRDHISEIIVPRASAGLAAAVRGARVIPIESLGEAIEHVMGVRRVRAFVARSHENDSRPDPGPDLVEVKGQELAKRALVIAASGGHNVLMEGPPGTGKTLLARCLPGILPPLDPAESLLVSKIAAFSGRPPETLVRTRPFRSPHSNVSVSALVGGGSVPRPGEVSLAHGGVLFLDELPEFRRDVLESLRQPLEDGFVSIVRTKARLEFPARFALVAAMNPCPCGYHGDPRHDCRCSPGARQRYSGRISGPLLDRIDLRVLVPRIGLDEYRRQAAGEDTVTARGRVETVRRIQKERDGRLASRLTGRDLDQADVGPQVRATLERAYDRFGLSLRSVHRVLRVARTIADLEGQGAIEVKHLGEALQYRIVEKTTSVN